MSNSRLFSTIRFLSLATAALVTGPALTYAAMDAPKPKIDCSAVENVGKVECAAQNQPTADDKVYESAYWRRRTATTLRPSRSPPLPRTRTTRASCASPASPPASSATSTAA